MKNIILMSLILCVMCVGCLGPVNISYKGVSNYNRQEATTDGEIENKPFLDSEVIPTTDNDANINANTKVKTNAKESSSTPAN